MIKYVKIMIVKSHSFLRRVARFILNRVLPRKPEIKFVSISKEDHLNRLDNYLKYQDENKKIAFVTAISGKYEELKVPEFFDFEMDYFIFTDDESLKVFQPFKKIVLNKFEVDPTRIARWVKLNHYRVLNLIGDYDFVIWVDSNLLVRNSLLPYVELIKRNNTDLGMFKHPARISLKQEVEACQRLNKDSIIDLDEQYNAYKEQYDIEEINKIHVIETNVYIANIKSKKTINLFFDWYQDLFRYTRRDQISLPVALYKNKELNLTSLEGTQELTPRFNKFSFEIFRHEDKETYITPSYLPLGDTIHLSNLELSDKNADSSLSIVVPIFNAPDEVSELLSSISNQEDKDFELILVDDGSQQKTADLLVTYVNTYKNTILVKHEVNKGYTTTVNDGVSAASNELITVLNSDTVLPKTFVSKIKEYASKYPSISAFGPITNAGSWQNTPMLHDESGSIAINALPKDVSVDKMNDLLASDNEAKGVIKVNLLNGFCYTVRKSVYDDIGLLDVEGFPSGYGEEDDFFIRLNLQGYQVGIIKELYVYHHKTKSFTSAQKQEFSKKGQKTLHSKYTKKLVVRLVKNSALNPELSDYREFVKNKFYV
jgi:O-antigen biosynthesis protein